MINHIEKLRKDRNLTFKEAGDKVGLSRSGYCKVEKRWPNISLSTLVKVANAFGYKVKIGVVETSSNHLES